MCRSVRVGNKKSVDLTIWLGQVCGLTILFGVEDASDNPQNHHGVHSMNGDLSPCFVLATEGMVGQLVGQVQWAVHCLVLSAKV